MLIAIGLVLTTEHKNRKTIGDREVFVTRPQKASITTRSSG
jgi:hypothetical protein